MRVEGGKMELGGWQRLDPLLSLYVGFAMSERRGERRQKVLEFTSKPNIFTVFISLLQNAKP